MRFRIESTVEKRIRVKIMISVLGNFIHILLASSVYCLKYAEPVCANIPQPQVKCTFNNDCKTDQLVFAHVIFRHGERNIEALGTFPNDPYKDESHWPGGFGALTNAGKQDVYELGFYLRRRYGKLIGEHYSPNDVYIHSTNFDRTLMSAQCLASGLFPPREPYVWNKDLLWQPIPIRTGPLTDEPLIAWKIPCPRFMHLFELYKSSSEYKSIFTKYKKSIKSWEDHSGKSLKKLAEIMYLYDTLFVENQRGLALDDWANKSLSDKTLEYLAAFHLQSFTHSTELKKLEGGFLIKEMLDRFTNKSQSLLEPNRSLWIYAAHDITLVNLLSALNLYDMHIPQYAASLHFELYQNEREYYVQLFYRNNKQEIVEALEIPNCGGTKCRLEQFYEVYKDILPAEFEDYDTACRLSV